MSAADRLDFAIGPAEDDGLFDRLEVAGHREEEIGFDGDLGVGNVAAQRKEEKEI